MKSSIRILVVFILLGLVIAGVAAVVLRVCFKDDEILRTSPVSLFIFLGVGFAEGVFIAPILCVLSGIQIRKEPAEAKLGMIVVGVLGAFNTGVLVLCRGVGWQFGSSSYLLLAALAFFSAACISTRPRAAYWMSNIVAAVFILIWPVSWIVHRQ